MKIYRQTSVYMIVITFPHPNWLQLEMYFKGAVTPFVVLKNGKFFPLYGLTSADHVPEATVRVTEFPLQYHNNKINLKYKNHILSLINCLTSVTYNRLSCIKAFVYILNV